LDAPTKIAYFNNVSFLDKNVLWLDISMDEALFVHVVDARANLNEEIKGCIFTEELFFPN